MVFVRLMTRILATISGGALHYCFMQQGRPSLMRLHLGPAACLQQALIAPCPRPSSGGNNVATSMNVHEAAQAAREPCLPFHFASAKPQASHANAIRWPPSYRSLARGIHSLLRTSLPSSHLRWHNRQAGAAAGTLLDTRYGTSATVPILALQMVLMGWLTAFELSDSQPLHA
ncbi:hypothetical protein GY45DRAFT_370149 [Cubamyces sp. BRFM 1775]|nr:hypothetical protein GY45DRAFT_370149 [Cubamyces sp. BRFM 1775]